jgi:hypothetical protein
MATKKTPPQELDYIPFKPRHAGGRPLHYQPEELEAKFQDFVAWAQRHPIKVKIVSKTSARGEKTEAERIEERPRLISVAQFLNWLGETKGWWTDLSDGEKGAEFSSLKERIRAYCFEYQYEAASTWQYNGNIVSRYLGLAEKKQLSGEKGPLTFIVKSEEEKDKLAEIGNLGV